MSVDLKGRSLLTLKDLSRGEIAYLIDSAIACKEEKRRREFKKRLANRNLCGIFLKPSTRTRTSFIVAAQDEGAHFEVFGSDEFRFGQKESIADIARVLGRMFDGIAFRGFDHRQAEELARYAGAPVWNGLTDDYHPTQVLADFMTLREEFGELAGLKLAYVGDAKNNMLTSLAIGAVIMGLRLSVVAPGSLQPDAEIMGKIFPGSVDKHSFTVTDDIEEGLAGCDAVYTDVWVSMGDKADLGERTRQLKGFRITEEVMEMTGKSRTIFLHCLPSIHNVDTEFGRTYPDLMDTDDGVFEGKQSRVFDQSENRMHTIKAMMIASLAD